MAPEGLSESVVTTLTNVLTIGNKPYNVVLTDKYISWTYKGKQPFIEKGKSTSKCKNIVVINEIVAVEYVENEPMATDAGDIEMVSINATTFKIHVVKRIPKNVWKLKTIELRCETSAQCALWVDSIRSLLEKYKNRPKSLLVFINPYGGKRKAKKIFEDKVAPLFDLAGITSHTIITERANHAKEYIETHDLNRYHGIVCVGGDGMFAELLNGLLILHNGRLGVNLDDERERLSQPPLRIGVIPAGSTDTISYCTNGANDVVTAALHIIIGDSMAMDVCSVRNGHTGKLIRFCVSMLGYGFYGDVLKHSESLRWIGPMRYNVSGFKTLLRNRSYEATVHYLPAQALEDNHHPGLEDGSRCYTGCNICKSASLIDLNGSVGADRLSALDWDADERLSALDQSVIISQLDLSDSSRPSSSLSKYSPESWQTVTGRFIGINALTISCRCATVPDGVSPACHLGDGCSDLVLVHDASRVNYFRHLYRHSKNSSQFDFDFVDIIRTKAFKVRVNSDNGEKGKGRSASAFHKLSNEESSYPKTPDVSCWNCDGEVIEEPNINARVHCQLVKIFARGIEHPAVSIDCSTSCLSCATLV